VLLNPTVHALDNDYLISGVHFVAVCGDCISNSWLFAVIVSAIPGCFRGDFIWQFFWTVFRSTMAGFVLAGNRLM